MPTAQNIIDSALRLCNIQASGEITPPAMSADALVTFNDMLDAWSAERLMVPSVVPQTFPLVPGQQSYKMGPGGDFNVPRPPSIERASIVNLSNPSQPLELSISYLTEAQWQAIPVKNIQSSLPLNVWDDQGFPLRTLYYWTIPSVNVNTILYTWEPITQPVTLATALAFPPGYSKAVRYNLAVDLCAEYGKPVDPSVAAIAATSLMAVKRINSPLAELRCDPALLYSGPGTYNWLTDNANKSGG